VKCEEVRGFTDLYIDGEFDQREAALFQEHLNECEGCRQVVLARQSFVQALRQKLGPPRMPSDASERVRVAVMRTVRARSGARSFALPVAVAASALVLVVAAAGWLRNIAPSGEVAEILDESVAVHEAGMPLALETAAVDKIMEFVSSQMDGDKSAPPLTEDDSTRLQGVGLARIGTSKALLFKYLHNGQVVSVVRMQRDQVPADALHPPSKAFVREVYRGARHGHVVTLYQSPYYTTTVVGDLPERDLVRLVPVEK